MAQELIELYARRRQATGYAFPPDGDWQRDFETRFDYDETDDQLNATAEIKQDMEKGWPMDRLLCGDVGVGKTEVVNTAGSLGGSIAGATAGNVAGRAGRLIKSGFKKI